VGPIFDRFIKWAKSLIGASILDSCLFVMGFGHQPSSWTLNAADLGDRQVTWPVGAVGQTNSQWKKGEAHSLVPRTNLRSLPSETGVKEIPNNAERNDRNRNLEGATVNAPGAELARRWDRARIRMVRAAGACSILSILPQPSSNQASKMRV